jgi:hypothetical protein
MQSEFNATQKEMPNVLFVMGLDIAQMVIRLFKLPLDKKIWTMRVVGFFVRFEHGLAVIAGEGRSGYMVSMKLHGSVPATRMSSHGTNGAMYRNLSVSFCGRQTLIAFETMDLAHCMRFVVALRVRRNRLHAEVSAQPRIADTTADPESSKSGNGDLRHLREMTLRSA